MIVVYMEEMLVMPIQIIDMPLALDVKLQQFIPQTHLHNSRGNQKTGA